MKLLAIAVVPLLLLAPAPALAVGASPEAPAGRSEAPAQITWAVHTTLVPTYFDPAETTIITSFMVLYAIHDGVVKPMPGKALAPSLAESWSVSPDGLLYDFVLGRGVKFHSPAASSPTAAIRTSTGSSANRPPSWPAASARRCCIACSSS
jgi:ABC-type transport system substrate-binding protein